MNVYHCSCLHYKNRAREDFIHIISQRERAGKEIDGGIQTESIWFGSDRHLRRSLSLPFLSQVFTFTCASVCVHIRKPIAVGTAWFWILRYTICYMLISMFRLESNFCMLLRCLASFTFSRSICGCSFRLRRLLMFIDWNEFVFINFRFSMWHFA